MTDELGFLAIFALSYLCLLKNREQVLKEEYLLDTGQGIIGFFNANLRRSIFRWELLCL